MDLSEKGIFFCAQEKFKTERLELNVPETLSADEISEIHHLKAVHLGFQLPQS